MTIETKFELGDIVRVKSSYAIFQITGIHILGSINEPGYFPETKYSGYKGQLYLSGELCFVARPDETKR